MHANLKKMATFEGTMELLENGDPQANHSSLEESVHEDIRERMEKRNMLFRMKAVEEAIGPLVDQVWLPDSCSIASSISGLPCEVPLHCNKG